MRHGGARVRKKQHLTHDPYSLTLVNSNDTHFRYIKNIREIKKTDLSDAASHEIAVVLKETTDAISSDLATRRDVELIIQRKIEKIRKEIAQSKSEIIKWVTGMLVAQLVVIATLVKLL